MKQLVILSGKGGTGKTSVAAAFSHLAAEGEPAVRAVLADANVDAANEEAIHMAPQPAGHWFRWKAATGRCFTPRCGPRRRTPASR